MLWLDGDYLELLQKAYETICNEEARANYEEEWQEMQKYQDAEQAKSESNEQQEKQPIEQGQSVGYEQQEYQPTEQVQSVSNEQQEYQPIEQVQSASNEQQVQPKKEIQFTPIMTESSMQKTKMRNVKKRVQVIKGKQQTYTGKKITRITPNIEEQQKLSEKEIQFTPIMTESSIQKTQEQQAKKQQTKEPFFKKILGMINKEKVSTSKLMKEVTEGSKENNSIDNQKETTIDREEENEKEDMQL